MTLYSPAQTWLTSAGDLGLLTPGPPAGRLRRVTTLSQRRATLLPARTFARLAWHEPPPAVRALHTWLDSWRGVGDVIGGLNR